MRQLKKGDYLIFHVERQKFYLNDKIDPITPGEELMEISSMAQSILTEDDLNAVCHLLSEGRTTSTKILSPSERPENWWVLQIIGITD
jgi:hypothetical protein